MSTKKKNTKTAKPRAKPLTKEQLERRKQQNIETLGHLFGMDVRRIAAVAPANPPKQVQLTLAAKLASHQAQKEFAIAKLKELEPNWTPSRTWSELDSVH